MLHLLPTQISDTDIHQTLPQAVPQALQEISYYLVENVKTARRFMVRAGAKARIDASQFHILNKHTSHDDLQGHLMQLAQGRHIALLSEAGAPAVADPGANIVRMAHELQLPVRPYVGPSSILLALMASGLNGQNFAFVGYLPVQKNERAKRIKTLERLSQQQQQTQMCIEAPYRNMQLFEAFLKNCRPGTLLSVAANLTAKNEFIRTQTIAHWKSDTPDIHKQPAIFSLLA